MTTHDTDIIGDRDRLAVIGDRIAKLAEALAAAVLDLNGLAEDAGLPAYRPIGVLL